MTGPHAGAWRRLTLPVCLFLLAIAPGRPAAASPEELFARGNEAYARGDYPAAAKAYQAILDSGIRNSRVYYNLGNACFKLNRIGQAILNYEKALKLDPTDAEARENLSFANLRIRDRIPADDLPYLLALLQRGEDLLRLEQVTRVFLVLYFTGLALAAVWILGRGRRWAFPLGIAALSVCSLAVVAGSWMALQSRARSATDAAIVLAEKVDVLSGPGAENTLLASVHEGTKVRVHNRRGEWAQVTLPDGRAGWMKGETLGTI